MLNKELQWQSGGSGTDRGSEATQLVHSRNPETVHPDVTMGLLEIRSQAQIRETGVLLNLGARPHCPGAPLWSVSDRPGVPGT